MRTFRLTTAITVMFAFAGGSAHAGGIGGAQFVRDARTLAAGARVQMRDADGAMLELGLRPVEVFTADARVLLVQADGSERPLPLPEARYFAVEPDAGARGIVVAYDDGRVEGLIERDGAYRRVHADGEALRLEPLQAKSVPERNFQCGNDDLGAAQYRAEDAIEGIVPAIRAIAPEAALAVRTARLAVDTDEEFLGRFGGNSATATQYVGNLIGFISSIYDTEVATSIQVSYLRLWTPGTDPWTETTAACLMYQSGKHWNDNQAAVSRTMMHFFSGKSTMSGIAWIGVLCSGPFNVEISGCSASLPNGTSNYGGAYGATMGLSGSFSPGAPNPGWDVYSIAHELGHNFNSPHTHCYMGLEGNAAAIDQCATQSGAACHQGAAGLPGPQGAGSGTIMSYCHLRPGGFSNMSLTLGTGHPFGVLPQRVPTRMTAHALSRATANPSCLALQASNSLPFANGFE
jgi:hypothetical protein